MKQENCTCKNDYLLGLDIGTGSVGWAVTTEDYKLQKCNKKDLWGIRLFETAKTAEERRLHRNARRRIARRRNRIKLLQELFAEEISEKDPAFFMRLKESAFYSNDKTEKQKNSLFNDKDFTDNNYHKTYPTIHHLIQTFIRGDIPTERKDVRLLYLACHNIIKYRGHFLFPGEDFNADSQLSSSVAKALKYLRENMNIDFSVSIDEMQKILENQELKPSEKQKNLEELLGITATDKQKKEVVKMIVGLKYDFAVLFSDGELKNTQPSETAFSKIDFEAKANEFESILGDRVELILLARAVYNCSVLSKIIGNADYLSAAKVNTYEKHKTDLALLKKFIKKYYGKDEYRYMFRSSDIKNNYCNYIGLCKKNGKKIVLDGKTPQGEFYNYISNVLGKNETAKTDQNYLYILDEIEKVSFLPKQIDKRNSEIPYQLRKLELEQMLFNAENYFPFLKNKDENGLTVKDKIISLLTFKIPYYIGIVNDSHKKQFPTRCWIVKKDTAGNKKLTPWNFDKIVDKEKTAESFIRSRTNKCTYLIGEDVLPKCSLLYSEYMVLNEINNLKINVNGVDVFNVELKKLIFEGLFKRQKTVTQKSITNFLIREGKCKKDDNIIITGVDTECTTSLNTYIQLEKVLGVTINKIPASDKEMLEKIIFWATVYDEGDGKEILRAKIYENYSDKLTDEQIKKISGLKFSGWGKFSKKLLAGITSPFPQFSDEINIITVMRETNSNLMELLSNQYQFTKEIDLFNSEFKDDTKNLSYSALVKDLYISPSVKRMIWQTLRIVKEIKKIQGTDPKKIFVEMARGDEAEKGRTKSRRALLQKLYKNCKISANDWGSQVAELKEKIQNEDNLKLKSDKLYLYYTQMGKCMYCGKTFDVNNVFNTQIYDIDHIYPQSKIKDDSLNNRVLVCSHCNKSKEDKYPVSSEIQNKQKAFWNFLQQNEFITVEKLNRLTRNMPLTADEIGKFIARQLVETRQGTKEAARILQELFPHSQIVYVKAPLVSFFRNKFELVKCREINDVHHAHDAYLNIVVGNVYNTKYTNDPRNFIKERRNETDNESYNFFKVFDYDVSRHNCIAWKKEKTILDIKNTLERNTVLYTRYSQCKQGGLFDQTIMKKGNGQMPLKANAPLSNISSYGGYNKISAAYYILLEHQKGKDQIRSLETVPLYLANKIKKDPRILNRYLSDLLQTSEFRILLPKIKINALLKIDGFLYHITGKTGNSFLIRSAIQFYCDTKETLYFKKIINTNSVIDAYKRLKKDFCAYDSYSFRMYVKDVISGKKNEANISKEDFTCAVRQQNEAVYDKFYNKYKTSIYRHRGNSTPLAKLKEKKELFAKLTVEKQFKVLLELLKFFKAINESIDLKPIDGKTNSGIMCIGKNFSSLKECILISQSVTGLFEQKTDLLEL